ncbi:MAG: NTP transferase domain-containing protein [Clostridiales bacterium]|nr:NTP transferase domain-containing protein [Clostridiales bacterium]
MKAIILAGEGNQDIEYFGQGKALVNFREEPLIEYTINALADSEMIDYILVVGNKDVLTPIIGDSVDKIIGQENDILDNLIKSISYFNGEENVVVVTCDIPLITSDAIRYFINNALDLKVDLCYPIIEKSVYMAKYPDARRTYVILKEGEFTGGNLIMINPCKIRAIENQIRSLVNNRKNPLRMTRTLGMFITIQFLLRQLTIEKIETYVQKKFSITGKALVVPYPEVGSDIDNVEDIKVLEKYI